MNSGNGDRGAHAALHEAIVAALPAVRRFARSLSGNPADADDLLQSTVERTLARSRPPQVDVGRWMFRICRNLWIDELRARGVRRDAAAREEPAVDQVVGAGSLLDELTFDEVLKAMDRLTEEQRAVLSLVAIEGLSYREAAEVLEVPVGTVMSRLSRARAALVGQFDAHPVDGRTDDEPAGGRGTSAPASRTTAGRQGGDDDDRA
jgi:RNA polymerase sigma factor (sigma-70 family)